MRLTRLGLLITSLLISSNGRSLETCLERAADYPLPPGLTDEAELLACHGISSSEMFKLGLENLFLEEETLLLLKRLIQGLVKCLILTLTLWS